MGLDFVEPWCLPELAELSPSGAEFGSSGIAFMIEAIMFFGGGWRSTELIERACESPKEPANSWPQLS